MTFTQIDSGNYRGNGLLNRLASCLVAGTVMLGTAFGEAAGPAGRAAAEVPASPVLLPTAEKILATGQRVADWQRVRLNDFDYVRTYKEDTADRRGWIQASLLVGMTRWADRTGDEDTAAAIASHVSREGFELGDQLRHADDQAIGQTYMWLYEKNEDQSVLQPTRDRLDAILTSPPTGSLEFIPSDRPGFEGTCQARWCWCDALFMAPRLWAQMSEATGDPAYLAYADREFWATTDYLYDDELHLYYRDSRFFDQDSPNGAPVFWSRGNGWVFAGLAIYLEELPSDHANRQRYETLFQEMAGALVPLQRENGYWPPSLLDPQAVATPETSGTAFITFGLAWGLNNGLLDGADVEQSVARGWSAIDRAVTPGGRVNWVQQVGKSPDPVEETDTQLYGVGAVLLAAPEVAVLADE